MEKLFYSEYICDREKELSKSVLYNGDIVA